MLISRLIFLESNDKQTSAPTGKIRGEETKRSVKLKRASTEIDPDKAITIVTAAKVSDETKKTRKSLAVDTISTTQVRRSSSERVLSPKDTIEDPAERAKKREKILELAKQAHAKPGEERNPSPDVTSRKSTKALAGSPASKRSPHEKKSLERNETPLKRHTNDMIELDPIKEKHEAPEVAVPKPEELEPKPAIITPTFEAEKRATVSSSIRIKMLQGNFECLSSPQDIFLKLTVPTKTGQKIKRSKCQRGTKLPKWSEDFEVESPNFPIRCQCFARVPGESDKNIQLGSFSIDTKHVVSNLSVKKTFTFSLQPPHTGKAKLDLELEFKEVTRRALGKTVTLTNRQRMGGVASPRD